MNISSIIVHARPGHAEDVRARLVELDNVEIHAVSAEGKIIVTLEVDGDAATTELFERISKLDDVLSASMVYHQIESDPDKEI